MTIQIAVCGPRYCTPAGEQNAYQVGQLLAGRGVTVICGGGTGVMAAVAAGVCKNGTAVGIRPGGDRTGASPDLSITLVTNMGEARNAIIVWSTRRRHRLFNKPWDTMSGVIISREAGAAVTDLDGADHTTDSQVTIAATRGISAELLHLVRTAIASTLA